MKIRVYYADTDCGGVVYHSRYVEYMERSRTEFIRERNIDLLEYHKKGILFVVADLQIKYCSSAKYDDLLTITSELIEAKGFKLLFRTTVTNQQGEICTIGEVKLVSIDTNQDNKVIRIPKEFLEQIKREV